MRRYEILPPLRFNDGTVVPDDLVGAVLVALRDRFSAVPFETQAIRGIWQHEGRHAPAGSERKVANTSSLHIRESTREAATSAISPCLQTMMKAPGIPRSSVASSAPCALASPSRCASVVLEAAWHHAGHRDAS